MAFHDYTSAGIWQSSIPWDRGGFSNLTSCSADTLTFSLQVGSRERWSNEIHRRPNLNAPASANICLACIGGEPLRQRLAGATGVKPIRCAYCRRRRCGVTLGDIADAIDEPLRMYYGHGGLSAHFTIESTVRRDSEVTPEKSPLKGPDSSRQVRAGEGGKRLSGAEDVRCNAVRRSHLLVLGQNRLHNSMARPFIRLQLPGGEARGRTRRSAPAIPLRARFLDGRVSTSVIASRRGRLRHASNFTLLHFTPAPFIAVYE